MANFFDVLGLFGSEFLGFGTYKRTLGNTRLKQ